MLTKTRIAVDSEAVQREVERLIDVWSDPEVWPPKGQGCWTCHHFPPVVWLDNTALCFTCFGHWFPGWPDERVADWLLRQVEQAAAWAEGKEARLERDKQALEEWLNN